jgi:hypothetical protein
VLKVVLVIPGHLARREIKVVLVILDHLVIPDHLVLRDSRVILVILDHLVCRVLLVTKEQPGPV